MSRSQHGQRRDLRRGALTGILAATLTVAAMIAVRQATGIVSLLDALAEIILAALPIALFSALLRLFGTDAKAWLLVGIFAGLIGAGALVGRSFARRTAGSRRVQWRRGLTVGGVAFLPLALALVWGANIGAGGALTGPQVIRALLALAATLAVFGLALSAGLALLRRTDPPPGAPADAPPADLSRRRLLTRAGLGVVSLAGIAVLGREVSVVRSGDQSLTSATGELPPAITPTEDFYVISKNFRDPQSPGDDWTITVEGLVERPLTLRQQDLDLLIGPEFVSTLTCISNPIGGPLISTARWTGAPLASVLAQAGLKPGVVDVVLHGRDGYADSLPLEKALAPFTALVWAMNGEPLTRFHGAPARIIVPGRYGIKNVKWLERIELVDHDARGYWQRRGWTETAIVKTASRIDVPANRGFVRATDAEIAGIAFAGDRGISAVEVSADDADTWQPAQIIANPSNANLSWVLWRLPWQPAPGAHTLLVRATDGAGDVQTAESTPTLPDGASGWHEIVVGVA